MLSAIFILLMLFSVFLVIRNPTNIYAYDSFLLAFVPYVLLDSFG